MSSGTQTFQDDYRDRPMLVVGLGLSGVSALRYLVREGAQVTVTDSRAAPAGIEALRAEFPQVRFQLGRFAAPAPLSQFAEAVVSPGIDLAEPFIRELREAGVPVVGDVELFARALRAPDGPVVIAITGSNGKSTVTTLVGEMARAAGWNTAVGGNLGTPALDLLAPDVQCYVLELSSFQLETTGALRCAAAVILNLSEDHLDRHGSMATYGAAKARIWSGAEQRLYNREDAAVAALLGAVDECCISFGLDTPPEDRDYGLIAGKGGAWLARGEMPLLPVSALRIAGTHNQANALAALALAEAAGIPREAALSALSEFSGLPHRCRLVATRDGIRYYNDSKGTNVGATLAALQGLEGPLHWLAGGQGKGQDFAPLVPVLVATQATAYLYGEDAGRIADALDGAVSVQRHATLDAAFAAAVAAARRGEGVLLSPACASLDQFRSYIERGTRFEALVEALP